MSERNKHGLSRDIPAETKRVVRRNSKFGCVMCRRGIYVYEHIEPTFDRATSHDPERICCLCAGCHDAVTRGQISKALVAREYQRVRAASADEVGPPVGPLDFHTGDAVLEIGELRYAPAVRNVFVYHGVELIGLSPSSIPGEPGHINAVFTDEAGEITASLNENGWEGSTGVWDVEVVANTLTMRRRTGEISLRLVLKPPGIVVVDRLDMRFGDAHFLVGSGTYAVGRYVSETDVAWVHVALTIHASSPGGCAIEFMEPETLRHRFENMKGTGQWMSDAQGIRAIHSNAGAMVIPLGIAIGGLTGTFTVHSMATGVQPLTDVRRIIVEAPNRIGAFIATGSTS